MRDFVGYEKTGLGPRERKGHQETDIWPKQLLPRNAIPRRRHGQDTIAWPPPPPPHICRLWGGVKLFLRLLNEMEEAQAARPRPISTTTFYKQQNNPTPPTERVWSNLWCPAPKWAGHRLHTKRRAKPSSGFVLLANVWCPPSVPLTRH
ncbi:hypothetical protein niasHT_028887 [Heterodera trifolii]|uniref:Uncharacterized protein n=1 Tax=Heterodera trifolii TaxID=157864 RepID=A0ABD2KJA3_9BILA